MVEAPYLSVLTMAYYETEITECLVTRVSFIETHIKIYTYKNIHRIQSLSAVHLIDWIKLLPHR